MNKSFLKLLAHSKRNFFVLVGGFGFAIAWITTIIWDPIFPEMKHDFLSLTILWWIIGPLSGIIIATILRISYHIIKTLPSK